MEFFAILNALYFEEEKNCHLKIFAYTSLRKYKKIRE